MRKLIKQIVTAHGNDFTDASRSMKKLQEEIEFEKSKKMLKENGGKIPYHRWYKGEFYNYHAYGKLKGKVTGYFKLQASRRSGKRYDITYYKVHETGVMIYINETMCKMGICQGLTTPHKFQTSTKKEYDAAYRRFIKLVS